MKVVCILLFSVFLGGTAIEAYGQATNVALPRKVLLKEGTYNEVKDETLVTIMELDGMGGICKQTLVTKCGNGPAIVTDGIGGLSFSSRGRVTVEVKNPVGRYWKDKSSGLNCEQSCPLGSGTGCNATSLGSGECCCKSATD